MTPGLLLLGLGGGTATVLLLVAVRQWEAVVWRRRLVAYRLRLPTGLASKDLARWLSSIAALTHAPRGALLPSPPLVLETSATSAGLEYRLLVPAALQGAVLSSIGAVLSSVRVEPAPDRDGSGQRPVATTTNFRMAADLHLAGRHRQLAIERASDSSRTLAAALQPLRLGERIVWQWIVTGAGTPPPIRADGQQGSSLPWWLEEQAPADADGLRAARLKQRQPLLHATARLFVEAPTRARTYNLFGRAWGGIRLLSVPGSRLVRGLWPARLVVWQQRHRWLPSLRWPLVLNASELAGLMPWPVGDEPLPGLPAAITRQVPPPVDMPVDGTILADPTYPGSDQPLRLSVRDRLMHTALLGPTGTGKSTLMVNIALQDVATGDGLALLDPKADMAADLLDRIPERRWDDVVIINPADSERPVGFNPLASDGTEYGRELAVDHVLHVFREVWANFWGPRTEAVLRSGLLTLTAARAIDGSAFTVCELPRLLNDAAFRAWLSANPSLPASVREFWDWFNALSVAERTQVVGPVMNKLTALTQRTPLRLILGQSQGIDLAAAIRAKRLLILPLSRGLVGSETAALLSSLMIASLWQAILGRVRVPQAERHPYWLFVDEASEVVRLPIDLTDLMAEARGLGSGLTLATQHLSQLPPDVRRALLATVRSQVIFQVEPDDARLLARSFGPTLNEIDLRSLPAHEVALRLSINGQTSRPMTGITRPLPDSLGSGARLRAASRQRYGVDRRDVEAGLERRGQTPPVTGNLSVRLGSGRPGGGSREDGAGVSGVIPRRCGRRHRRRHGRVETTGLLACGYDRHIANDSWRKTGASVMRRLAPGVLSKRDAAILQDLARVRLLTGRQLERLHFSGIASTNARGSARRRSLGRLVDHGLVTALPRRVGGERAGSAGLVYTLDARAYRERPLWAAESAPTATDARARRPWAIGWLFVSHTLDVAELYVQLREAEARGELTILAFDAEPGSWYTPVNGSTVKPDAHVVIESGGWERHWWIEVDRATETLPTIRRKLDRYLDLLRTGQSGPDGVLPRVLVTAPNQRRADQLHAVVDEVRGGPGFVSVRPFNQAAQVLPGQEARPPPP